MKIKTNGHWRSFVYRWEVPPRVLATQFDWQNPDEYTDGFFCYRGHWYHLADFLRFEDDSGWHGYATDSFFSGVVIRLSSGGERYQIGTYIT